jgi:hypothetical protein
VSQLATLLLMINSTHHTQTTTKMDDLWSEIQDMPGEIFDFTELEENDSEMNVKCDEFNQKDYTV